MSGDAGPGARGTGPEGPADEDRAYDVGDPGEFVDVRRGRGSTALSDPDSLSPRLRARRAFTLVLLTLVAPGSAQIVAGNRRLGRAALRLAVTILVLVVLAGVVYLVSPATILGLLANPWTLGALSVALVGLGVFWAALFLDAIRRARLRSLRPGTRRLVAGLAALLMLVTSGTMFAAATTLWAGRTAVETVFGNHTQVPPAQGRYNVLLLGADSGKSRVGTRPDTIMLASVDARTGRSALFGFARDTENIDFREGSTMRRLMPQGWNCGDQCLLNGLYKWATDNKHLFPPDVADPGALAMIEAVEALSGLDIQYHVLVDLKGFQRLVDAVGGIDVVVGKRTPIGGGTSPISGWIEPGEQHLDGYHALWYARSREGSTNYERMARQRCVLQAMLHQLSPATVVTKSQQIAAVSGSVLRTDIPTSDLGVLGDLALKARSHKVKAVNFVPPLIKPWRYEPQVIRDTVAKTIESTKSDRAAAPSRGSASAPARSTGDAPARTPGPTGSATKGSGSGSGSTTDDLATVCSVP